MICRSINEHHIDLAKVCLLDINHATMSVGEHVYWNWFFVHLSLLKYIYMHIARLIHVIKALFIVIQSCIGMVQTPREAVFVKKF